jgi:hypothetical protein
MNTYGAWDKQGEGRKEASERHLHGLRSIEGDQTVNTYTNGQFVKDGDNDQYKLMAKTGF